VNEGKDNCTFGGGGATIVAWNGASRTSRSMSMEKHKEQVEPRFYCSQTQDKLLSRDVYHTLKWHFAVYKSLHVVSNQTLLTELIIFKVCPYKF
jgi:hypothetical protein